MKRRHLFDNGFPVCTPTLLAGAEVLLAISRQSLKRSRAQLAASLVGLADSANRVCHSLARLGASEFEMLQWRQRYSTLFANGHRKGTAAGGEEGARVEPGGRAACQEPDLR